MEPSFWSVMLYVIPVFVAIFLLTKGHGRGDNGRTAGHNQYKNYRKTRMDKPVV